VTSSVLRTSSPKGEDSALGVLCPIGLWFTYNHWCKKASPLGEVGGVGLLPSVLDEAFKGEL